MRNVLIRGLAAATVCGAVLAGCGGSDPDAADDGRVDVVAGAYPVAFLAEQVGGDRVAVTSLTPPGVEPHDVELGTREVDRIEDADLVLYLGEGFQPAVEKAAERRDEGSLDLLQELELLQVDGGADPHVWLDPRRMGTMAERVGDALAELDPEHADAYASRAASLIERLSALDQEFTTGLETCDRRLLVTTHEAFTYLANRYELEQEPLAGISPEAEPDPKRLAELADLVRERGVTTVFTEALAPPRVAEALGREAGVRTAVLDPLEGLGEAEGDQPRDYFTVMRENLRVLREALGCA